MASRRGGTAYSGFTSTEGNSIGRITTKGMISVYRHPSIDGLEGITTGPDGALWYTNFLGGSIGHAGLPT